MVAGSRGQVVEFYYDISCPFAYIASTRIVALATRTQAQVIYRPVLLGAIYRLTAAPQGGAGSASDVFNSTKRTITSLAFQSTLKRYGIEHNTPPKHPVKTTAALRLLYHVDGEDRVKLTTALFRAYWVEGRAVNDKSVLVDVVKQSSIEDVEGVVKAINDGSFEGATQRQQLEQATALAVKRGTPGVPAFWIPGVARLYWGQDRMHFVEAELRLLNQSGSRAAWAGDRKPLQGLIPRCVPEPQIPNGEQVKLEFWYDFSSPWAFLGWTQLARLQRQFGDRLQIDMKPFLLGILFREIGAPNTPRDSVSEQKRAYSALDHNDWCRWWNAVNEQAGKPDKELEFYWADVFPIRTPTVLRAVLVEPALVGVLFRACWERNLNMASDEVLHQVIAEAGYDATEILTRANEKKYKDQLRARTSEAKEVGLCGVPSYRVFRRKVEREREEDWAQVGDMVWGQDESVVVEDLIAGWNGQGVAKVEEDGARAKL